MIDFLVAMQSAVVNRVKGLGRKNDEGATAVEYGLMVALIAGVIIAAVTLLGHQVRDSFDRTCDAVASTSTPATNCDSGN